MKVLANMKCKKRKPSLCQRECYRNLLIGRPFIEEDGDVYKISDNIIAKWKKYHLNYFGYPDLDKEAIMNNNSLRPKTILLLNRPTYTHRTILNGNKVMKELQKAFPDWTIIHECFEKLPIREQLRIISNTSVMISQHGSGLLNIWYLPYDSLLVEVFQYLFNLHLHIFEDFCHDFGVQHCQVNLSKQSCVPTNYRWRDELEKNISLFQTDVKYYLTLRDQHMTLNDYEIQEIIGNIKKFISTRFPSSSDAS